MSERLRITRRFTPRFPFDWTEETEDGFKWAPWPYQMMAPWHRKAGKINGDFIEVTYPAAPKEEPHG